MTDLAYGIVCNVAETDRALRHGAKVWIVNGTGGAGWERFVVLAMSRGGRRITKWVLTTRLNNFRAAWVPPHLQDAVCYFRGTRALAAETADKLNAFVRAERERHPNRSCGKITRPPPA